MSFLPPDRPIAVIDVDKCKTNIRKMARKAAKRNLRYTPHFKTHQSIEIGSWFRDEGVDSIQVSSPDMANYFIHQGWKSITIAFPLSPSWLSKIDDLASRVNLTVFINSTETAKIAGESLNNPVTVFTEVDCGFNRSGIPAEDAAQFEKILNEINKHPKLRFYGFYVHDGRTYQCRSADEVAHTIHPVFEKLSAVKNNFPEAIIRLGDTPSCSLLNDFGVVSEISPGNNVFYDLMQVQIGSCSYENIAMAVVCPVAEVHPQNNKAILYGGAVHFSKERIRMNNFECYGQVVRFENQNFGEPVTEAILTGLAQEHGILHLPEILSAKLRLGDYLALYPVHSCLTANLFSHYLTTDGQRIEKRILS